MTFDDTSTAEALTDFLGAVTKPVGKQRAKARLWRGHADHTWRVDSTLFRRITTDPKATQWSNIKSAMRRSEETLLQRARHRGFGFVDGRQLSDFEVLARLRHYGAATSLLDVSKNPLVALWFACSELPLKDALVLGFGTNFIGGREEDSSEFNYFKEQDEAERYDNVIMVEPPSVSPRIAAQSGVFLYSRLTDSEFGSLIHDEDQHGIRAICITAKAKPLILEELSRHFAINRLSVFPDIEGFAASHASSAGIYDYERW